MDVSSTALQGLDQAQAQVNRSAARLASIGTSTAAGAGVDTADLSQEMVSLLAAKNQFGANIDILKIADEMQKNTINLLA